MRSSNRRIRDALQQFPELSFRRPNDPEGDTGPFLIFSLPDRERTRALVHELWQEGFKSAFRLDDYGLHIYYNITSLVQKVPLSPAGNPWSLKENSQSCYDYSKGSCPRSDDLFERSAIIPVPSRLSKTQEEEMTQRIRRAVLRTFSGG
jgi:8-amino-3,8-dideoxy-alpha-D-manno-octulosonate transaminase